MVEIALEHVEKIYPGGIRAVCDLSLTIPEGRLTVLVGPSGCGKTTTLRLIAGLEQVSAGTVAFDGRSVNRLSPKQRNVAMVFQNHALYSHMSVAENMGFGLAMRKVPHDEIARRIQRTTASLGIEELLDRRPGTLSGGQQQRVALGRALVRQPDIFLLDEPLSNIDDSLRAEGRTQIKRLQATLGSTMLYVTHDQVEAMTLGHRLAVMRAGRIEQSGTPDKLYRYPATRFVAGFLGTPTMNFVEGCLVRNDDVGLKFVADGGGFSLPLPVRLSEALAKYSQRRLTLGIRPEQLRCPTDESFAGDVRIEACLDGIESLGSECHFHLDTAGVRLICRGESNHSLRLGDRVSVALSTEKILFFAPAEDGGCRIPSDANS